MFFPRTAEPKIDFSVKVLAATIPEAVLHDCFIPQIAY